MPVTYAITFDVVPEQRTRFLTLLEGVLDAMRCEPMFHEAVLHRDPASEFRFMLYETWADHDDVLNVQLQRPYRQAWHAAFPELLARDREITIWQPIRADRASRVMEHGASQLPGPGNADVMRADAQDQRSRAVQSRTVPEIRQSVRTPTMDDPDLCIPVRYGPVEAVFASRTELPPQHLIGNVNIVPFVGDDAVVLRVASGRPEIPGGTLEPGEDHMAALRRELREEAGADLLSWTLLGAYRCHSVAEQPYRPHLPHPDFYRVVGYGEIALVTQPTNPPGGEQIVEVSVMPVVAADQVFRQWQRPDIAALFRLAATRRHSTQEP